MYNYNNDSSLRKIFVSSPMKSEHKGKAKIIIYENIYGEVSKISHLFTDNFIVGLYINDSSESRTNSKNIV